MSKKASGRPVLTILAVGNSTVGKSSIIKAFNGESFSNTILPTMAKDLTYVNTEIDIDGVKTKIRVKVWDSAGQERYQTLVAQTIHNTEGIFIVYDVTEQSTFNDLEKWIEKLDDLVTIKAFPIIVIGNKIDLTEKRVVKKEVAEEFCQSHGFPYFETTCKKSETVFPAIKCLLQKVYIANRDMYEVKSEPTEKKPVVTLEESKCCGGKKKEKNNNTKLDKRLTIKS